MDDRKGRKYLMRVKGQVWTPKRREDKETPVGVN